MSAKRQKFDSEILTSQSGDIQLTNLGFVCGFLDLTRPTRPEFLPFTWSFPLCIYRQLSVFVKCLTLRKGAVFV